MEFGQAVPLRLQRQYSEGTALASARDSRSNSQLWKGNKVTQQWQVGLSQSVSKLSREVAKMRRKPLGGGGIAAASAGANYPFQIYNIANFTDPTQNKYTFQIRSGLVGFRSSQYIPDGDFNGTMDCYGGNWEMPLVATGTDGMGIFDGDVAPYQFLSGGVQPDWSAPVSANAGGSVTLDAGGAATLICENVLGTSNPPGVQIVVPELTGFFTAIFWIKIVDPIGSGGMGGPGPYTQLYGLVTTDSNIGTDTLSDSISSRIIVGAIAFNGSSAGVISQCQYGHLFNRYIQASPFANISESVATNVPRVFRGLQSQIPPSSVQGGYNFRIYFPGDVVCDDNIIYYTAPSGGVNVGFYPCYLYNSDTMGEEQDGQFNSSPWAPSFMQLVAEP